MHSNIYSNILLKAYAYKIETYKHVRICDESYLHVLKLYVKFCAIHWNGLEFIWCMGEIALARIVIDIACYSILSTDDDFKFLVLKFL